MPWSIPVLTAGANGDCDETLLLPKGLDAFAEAAPNGDGAREKGVGAGVIEFPPTPAPNGFVASELPKAFVEVPSLKAL
jgi:hypothetical protein